MSTLDHGDVEKYLLHEHHERVMPQQRSTLFLLHAARCVTYSNEQMYQYAQYNNSNTYVGHARILQPPDCAHQVLNLANGGIPSATDIR